MKIEEVRTYEDLQRYLEFDWKRPIRVRRKQGCSE
jgi:hypothetical protein